MNEKHQVNHTTKQNGSVPPALSWYTLSGPITLSKLKPEGISWRRDTKAMASCKNPN